MIEFHHLKVSGRFRYLWLKYVTGVALAHHCASCLKGEYSGYFNTELRQANKISLNEHPARIVYLCGVANPYNWAKNFHLALIETEGNVMKVDELGICATIVNAERLPITADAMKAVNHPQIGNKRYSTCRNWQFANKLYLDRGILHPQEQ